jgi:ferredoxin-thioredoxin reductase catalytic subunit
MKLRLRLLILIIPCAYHKKDMNEYQNYQLLFSRSGSVNILVSKIFLL